MSDPRVRHLAPLGLWLAAAPAISLVEGTPDELPAVALGSIALRNDSTLSRRSPSLGNDMVDATPDDDRQRSMTELVREMGARNAPREARVRLAVERLGEIEQAQRELALAEARRRRFRFW